MNQVWRLRVTTTGEFSFESGLDRSAGDFCVVKMQLVIAYPLRKVALTISFFDGQFKLSPAKPFTLLYRPSFIYRKIKKA